jgi:hypothetical protein
MITFEYMYLSFYHDGHLWLKENKMGLIGNNSRRCIIHQKTKLMLFGM